MGLQLQLCRVLLPLHLLLLLPLLLLLLPWLLLAVAG